MGQARRRGRHVVGSCRLLFGHPQAAFGFFQGILRLSLTPNAGGAVHGY